MSTNKKTNRWLLLAAHLGTIVFMMACAVLSGAGQSDDDLFRFDNGAIEVRDENGNWAPVAGTSFELVGELENTDPWMVAGREFETRDTTMIEDGLAVGDIVSVRGIITEDETWVAYSIEGMDEQTDPVVVLIGVVDSVNPWSINGISLNVTDETEIQGDITVGTIVRVKLLLLEDGTWEVISIVPLGDTTDMAGCVTIVATVVSVSGNEIQFLGWPTTVTLETDNPMNNVNQSDVNNNGGENNDNSNEQIDSNAFVAGDVVQAVICISNDGTLIITQITILHTDDNNDIDSTNGEKVLICHKPDKKGGHTLSIASSAVPAHLAHGDTLGACP